MKSSVRHLALDGASITFDGLTLTADTGCVRRSWHVIPQGLGSVFLGHSDSDRNYLLPGGIRPDWSLEFGEGAAELRKVELRIQEQDYRNAPHLAAEAEFHYPEVGLLLRYAVSCYPGAPGIRTQLSLKSAKAVERLEWPGYLAGAYGEHLALPVEALRRTGFGYFNDSQHRYHRLCSILKEEHHSGPVSGSENYDFANGLILCGGDGGVALVKESHKCVNNSGVDTGTFGLETDGVFSTGLGINPAGKSFWLRDSEYLSCWANWCILFRGGEEAARRAIKAFDRARFPFRPERDRILPSNTWGSRGAGNRSRTAAEESNILREIDSAADLGLELIQIDDGWQFDPGCCDFEHCEWLPSAIRFPGGWKTTRDYARRKGVQLGLWFPWFAPLERILQNRREGGFRRFKLDFSDLSTRENLDRMMELADAVVREGYPEVGLNWDVTENTARFGYYFAREYGNLFWQNNEVSAPGCRSQHHIHYSPEVSLHEIWSLAKYMNLNQMQLTLQRNAESDRAGIYPQDYSFGITMLGLPLFFMETQRFTADERALLRPLIALYKARRDRILAGYVEPIGSEPTGKSWSGMQCRCTETTGFFTLFREAGAAEETFAFDLGAQATDLSVLWNRQEGTVELHSGGRVSVKLPKASFVFVEYR